MHYPGCFSKQHHEAVQFQSFCSFYTDEEAEATERLTCLRALGLSDGASLWGKISDARACVLTAPVVLKVWSAAHMGTC